MKKSEFVQRIQAIGQMGTIEEVRAGLVELQKDAETDYDERDTAITEVGTLKNANETLRSANMKLFLQVGSGKEPGKGPGKEPGKGPDPENTDDLKYDDLFNEEGGLK